MREGPGLRGVGIQGEADWSEEAAPTPQKARSCSPPHPACISQEARPAAAAVERLLGWTLSLTACNPLGKDPPGPGSALGP